LKHRSAAEPVIGYIKTDGKLGRNDLLCETQVQYPPDPQEFDEKITVFLCRMAFGDLVRLRLPEGKCLEDCFGKMKKTFSGSTA
jgi:hypothetical protein